MQSRSAQRPSRAAGFTLVELMVVVAIATILFAIAVPSYITYVRQSRRTEARTASSAIPPSGFRSAAVITSSKSARRRTATASPT